MGRDGMRWDGVGWDAEGWDEMGWDGMRWGLGWGGMGCAEPPDALLNFASFILLACGVDASHM